MLRGARLWAWISVGTGWLVTLVVGFMVGLDWRPAQIAITTLGILIVFGLAEGMRTRREHYEEYRREYTQRKQSEVQAERVRIARELHDVLAHSLSQINVQASVGLHLMDKQPEKASEALASIKETSKTALDEVRSVLGVLRAEDGRVVSNLLTQAMENRPMSIYGDGTQTRSFGYVDDTVDGLLRLLDSDVQMPVNLGTPTEFSILELVEAVRQVTGTTAEVVHLELPTDDPTQRQPDIGRAKELLGWKPEVTLIDGLHRYADWLSAQTA